MRDAENKTKENSMRGIELTAEKINSYSAAEGAKALADLKKQSIHAMEENEAFLMKLLQDNKDTEIGRKYDFASIKTIEEYQKRLPVTIYDDYAGYVIRDIHNNEDNLMTAYPIKVYCETSGSLGNPKIVPMTVNSIHVQQKYNSLICDAIKDMALKPGWKKGRVMTLLESKMTEMKKGKEYGCLSAIFMQEAKAVLPLISTTPAEAIFPDGNTDTRYLQARFGLAASDLVQISTTFLSFAAEILRYIEKHWQMLVSDIETGTINSKIRMSEDVREKIQGKITPMPERAAELRAVFEKGFDTPFATKVWPDLQLISGVGTGAFEIYEYKIRERYVDERVQFYFSGLSSTEGLFSVPLAMGDKKSAIVPHSMFYEFLPVDAQDDFSQIVTLDKVEVGRDYEIIMTNANGLYRYRMRDCIRIMDKYNELPLIQFQYRLNQVADIIDDHTEESAFTKTAMDTALQLGLDLVDYSVYPDRDAPLPRYVYFMEFAHMPEGITREQIRTVVHKNLEKYSPDIKEYIKKGIGAPTELHILQPETYMLYHDLMVFKGRNPAQVKPVHIIINEFHYRFFSKLIEEEWEK